MKFAEFATRVMTGANTMKGDIMPETMENVEMMENVEVPAQVKSSGGIAIAVVALIGAGCFGAYKLYKQLRSKKSGVVVDDTQACTTESTDDTVKKVDLKLEKNDK